MKIAAMWMCLILLIPGLATADDKPVVQVMFMDFTGYAERDSESGEVVGKGVQLLRKLFAEAGYRVEVGLLPPARIWQGLEDGTVHVWLGMLNKPDLDEHVLLGSRDLGRVGIGLYHLPGSKAPRWPEDLQDARVITITNFTYTADIWEVLNDRSRNLTVHRSSSHEGALQMLERGRGDYLLDYRTQVNSAARALGMEPLPGVLVAEMPVRFVFSRRSGFAEQLRADVDAAFDRLQARGVELDVTRQQAE